MAKDTPNFIANRIGTFSVLNVMRLMQELDLTIEEVDALTGPAVGWPRSATFRTLDLVGLDILGHVVRNMTENVRDERNDERDLPGQGDRIEQHSDRHEEQNGKEIAERDDLGCRLIRQVGLGQEEARDEGTESERQAEYGTREERGQQRRADHGQEEELR